MTEKGNEEKAGQGALSEEQRKAIVQKAAKALHAAMFTNKEAAEEWWAGMGDGNRTKQLYCDDAQAVLEAVGFFRLVEAAQELTALKPSGTHSLKWFEVPFALMAKLRSVLKEVLPSA